MGALDKRSAGFGTALFDVTISVNPRVFVSYLASGDGLRKHLAYCVLTVCWMFLGCVTQLSLSAVFPEFPLYPLPLAAGYLALHRSPSWAMACGLACGVLADAQWFSPLGTTSGILASVVVVVLLFRSCVPGLERRFTQSCVLAGGGAVFVYVALKLILYGVMFLDGRFMDLMPCHLLLGPLLNGLCLAPILYAVMDVFEWLTGLRGGQCV